MFEYAGPQYDWKREKAESSWRDSSCHSNAHDIDRFCRCFFAGNFFRVNGLGFSRFKQLQWTFRDHDTFFVAKTTPANGGHLCQCFASQCSFLGYSAALRFLCRFGSADSAGDFAQGNGVWTPSLSPARAVWCVRPAISGDFDPAQPFGFRNRPVILLSGILPYEQEHLADDAASGPGKRGGEHSRGIRRKNDSLWDFSLSGCSIGSISLCCVNRRTHHHLTGRKPHVQRQGENDLPRFPIDGWKHGYKFLSFLDWHGQGFLSGFVRQLHRTDTAG